MRCRPAATSSIAAARRWSLLPFALLGASGSASTSATEVVIFALACMALNILVGYTGLTSFGHGAWFGLAAYAAAHRAARPVPGLVPAAAGGRPRRSWSLLVAGVRLPDPAPARRVLLAADARAVGDAVSRWRSAGPRSPAARTVWAASRGRCSPACRSTSAGAYYALVAAIALRRRLRAVALPPLAAGHACWWRSARTSSARASSATRPIAYKLAAFVVSADAHRPGRHAAAVQQPHDLGRADLGGVLRRAAGDGDHRRHALVPRPGARRAVLRHLPRLPVARHRELAALLRPAVRRLHRVLADRAGRPLRARRRARWRPAAVGRRRDGAAPGRRGRAARRSCKPRRAGDGGVDPRGARHRASASAASARCTDMSLRRPRPHAARADRPERRRQDDRLQPDLGHVRARPRQRHARRHADRGPVARADHARRHRPLVPDHQPVRRR